MPVMTGGSRWFIVRMRRRHFLGGIGANDRANDRSRQEESKQDDNRHCSGPTAILGNMRVGENILSDVTCFRMSRNGWLGMLGGERTAGHNKSRSKQHR